MAETDGLLTLSASEVPDHYEAVPEAAASSSKSYRTLTANNVIFNNAFRRSKPLSIEQAMIECARVARRLLKLLESRREDVRASVGLPRKAQSLPTAADVDATRDRVMAALKSHLKYYVRQADEVQEDVAMNGDGKSVCSERCACAPCESPLVSAEALGHGWLQVVP
jgi:hypothetical protein